MSDTPQPSDQEKSERTTEKPFGTTVRAAKAEDAEAIGSILRDWVRDPADGQVIEPEVAEILQTLTDSLEGKNQDKFLVATDLEDKPIGMARLSPVSEEVLQFAQTARPVELFNLYVAAGQNFGKGVGTTLMNAVKAQAKADGMTEVLLNSGPRYKESGWGFYEKTIGPAAGVLKDHYGPGYDAMVWRVEV